MCMDGCFKHTTKPSSGDSGPSKRGVRLLLLEATSHRNHWTSFSSGLEYRDPYDSAGTRGRVHLWPLDIDETVWRWSQDGKSLFGDPTCGPYTKRNCQAQTRITPCQTPPRKPSKKHNTKHTIHMKQPMEPCLETAFILEVSVIKHFENPYKIQYQSDGNAPICAWTPSVSHSSTKGLPLPQGKLAASSQS